MVFRIAKMQPEATNKGKKLRRKASVNTGDEAALSEALVAVGLRRTPARLAVLQVLIGASRPMSHADLEDARDHLLDRVTLYRTLDSFVKAGLVAKHVGDDRISRFVLLDGVNHQLHSHFHCDDCGGVFCLPVKPPRKIELPEGFAAESASLSFHGHCPSCQEQPSA